MRRAFKFEELLAWVSSKTHPDAETIKKLQKQVEELSMAEQTEENRTEFLAASKKLDDILLKQEIYWAQRSQIAWLKHGDKKHQIFSLQGLAKAKEKHDPWSSRSTKYLGG